MGMDKDEAIIIARLLKRLIEQEVVRNAKTGVCYCPECGGSVWQNRDESKFCFRCGQAIKWE